MAKDLRSVADRLKTLRKESGRTQAELARLLGITRSGVNAWEMGLSVPSTPYIVELAKFYHVSTDYILGVETAETFVVSGLSETQIAVLKDVIRCFREGDS